MSILIINPGTGPVGGANLGNAEHVIQVFAGEVAARFGDPVRISRADHLDDDKGRFGFTLSGEKIGTHEVEMPGLPLERVRWVDEPDQNIWHYPRLYVDGESWVWLYAVNQCGFDEDSA